MVQLVVVRVAHALVVTVVTVVGAVGAVQTVWVLALGGKVATVVMVLLSYDSIFKGIL
jgi:hypothetical protein